MTTLCLCDYTPPRTPPRLSSARLEAIRQAVQVIGTAWGAAPVAITSARRAALDAIADGATATDAMHAALDVLSGRPR